MSINFTNATVKTMVNIAALTGAGIRGPALLVSLGLATLKNAFNAINPTEGSTEDISGHNPGGKTLSSRA